MNKPIARHHHEPAYDYHEIEKWIEKKTGRKLSDWAGRHTATKSTEVVPYQNFWHWLCDDLYVQNNSYFEIECDPETAGALAKTSKAWVKDILDVINAEFPDAEGRLNCYVAW